MIFITREELLAHTRISNVLDVQNINELLMRRSFLSEKVDSMLAENEPYETEAIDISDEIDGAISGGLVTEILDMCDEGFDLSGNKARAMKINEEIFTDTGYIGEVFGKFNPESNMYFALFKNETFEDESSLLGDTSVGIILPENVYKKILSLDVCLFGYDWFGAFSGGEWMFNSTASGYPKITVTEKISFVSTAFSRNLGLLETDIMKEKTAVVVGCGSVGSFIIMQLAKAGVGKFVFIDFDCLELHNMSRHWLGLSHLGEYKADAMALEVKRVNPNAEIKVFRGKIENAPSEYFEDIKSGIVIATGDNRACDAEANKIAAEYSLPFVSVGCWTRAAAGEVFRWMPNEGLPTYEEAFDGLITSETNSAHRAYFGNLDEAAKIRFEPGIYSDITFVSGIAVKLALDMLNFGNKNYTPRVYDHLTNYTLICNTNQETLGGRHASLFPHPLRITDKRDGIWLKKRGDAACLTISLL